MANAMLDARQEGDSYRRVEITGQRRRWTGEEKARIVAESFEEGANISEVAGAISATNNGASIYIEAKRKPEAYPTEKGAPMWKDILHARIPKGPGGQFNLPGPFTDMLMGYSKNQKAAKDFLRWMHSKPVLRNGSARSRGMPTELPGIGKRTRYGNSIPFCCRSAISRHSAGCQDMQARPIARPPKW